MDKLQFPSLCAHCRKHTAGDWSPGPQWDYLFGIVHGAAMALLLLAIIFHW